MKVVLEVTRGSKKTRKIRLKSPETIVGRREGCDLRIPSAAVSRRHCRLSFRDGYLTVEDLDSSNGTFVNGVRIARRQVVRPGDILEVGPLSLLVKYQLSQKAIDRLLEEGMMPADDAVVEPKTVEPEVVEPEVVADEPVVRKQAGKKNITSRRKTTKREAPAKKKPARKEPAEAPPTGAYDGEISLHLPPPEDLRDILSQMEDS